MLSNGQATQSSKKVSVYQYRKPSVCSSFCVEGTLTEGDVMLEDLLVIGCIVQQHISSYASNISCVVIISQFDSVYKRTGIWTYCFARASILGGLGVATPQILGRGSWVGRRGLGQVVKYYYILSCTGSIFESDDF